MRYLDLFLNIASLLLMTAVIMDTLVWFTMRYTIPSWTMAVMSAGVIVLIQVMRKLI